MSYIGFWVHKLAKHAPKPAICQFTKFYGLTVRNHSEGAKIILQLLFLARRRVLIENQTALTQEEHWRKELIFDI